MTARRFTVVDGDDAPVDEADSATRRPLDNDLHDDLDLDLDDDVDLDDDLDLDLDLDEDLNLDDDLDLDLDLDADADVDADVSGEDSEGGNDEVVSVSSALPNPHPRVSEAVRYLLDRYEMTSATEFPSAIAVVSALRGEGVTTVSQSLTEVLSVDFGYSACWVDVSWAQGAPVGKRGSRRRRGRSRSGAPSAGLLDVVGGQASLDDVIRTSDDTRVAYLGAGSTSASLREITRSIELHELFDELKSQYDIVVFDSAPVAENSSALSIIQQADAYVFVTQHGATTSHQVSEAIQLMDPLPAMGAVLNSYRSRTPRALRRFFPAER